MKMIDLLLPRITVVLLALAVTVQPILAQDTPQPDDPQSLAQALVDNLLAGNFAAAAEHFDSALQAALPGDTLEQAWNSTTAWFGPFQEQSGVQTQPLESYTLVVITLKFERATLETQVSVSADGQIGGLYFELHRNTTPAPPPTYDLPAYADPTAFEEQEITVNSGMWALPGTLTLPVGNGPFPAVVLVHGSGTSDRDESIGLNKPFRDLAWGLASRGIAVLRYDKRTLVYGARSANPPESLTVWEETINDALAAVALLRQYSQINPNCIFVLGHSLGGYLAPRIASQDSHIAGMIIMAGPTRPLETVYLDQVRYLLQLDGDLSAADQAQLDSIEQVVTATQNVQPTDPASSLLFNAPAAYWLDLNAYRPVEMAQGLSIPMLIMQGGRDYQVTAADFQGWRDGLSSNSRVTFISYPVLNHLFMAGEGPGTPEEYDVPGHVAESVIIDITNWIAAQS